MIFRKAVKDDFDNIKSLYWELIDQEQGIHRFHIGRRVSILLMKCCITVLIRKELYVLTDGGEMTFKMYALVL